MDPIKAALLRRERCGRSGLAESNGHSAWAKPYLQPASDTPAAAVKAAWEPVRTGQPVPMLGEEVGYAQPCNPI